MLVKSIVSAILGVDLEDFIRPGVFVDPAIFERLSHFTDHGIPGTTEDPFNRAAIADGSCRSVGVNAAGDAYFGWLDRVDTVITAM